MKTIKITDNPKITTLELINNLKKRFNMYSSFNESDINRYFPPPKKKTVREFYLSQKPDVLGKSWNDLSDVRESMMTFREYILFFEAYYDATGEYLDRETNSIFRDMLSDGGVAFGYWYPGYSEVRFGWDGAGCYDVDIGARLAISSSASLKTPSLESAIELVKKNGYKVIKEM